MSQAGDHAPLRYCDYDPLAWFYNRHWGDAYHRLALAAIENLAPGLCGPGRRTLDLCCGTGQLTRMLADKGCEVTGVDGSEEMLRFARGKVPTGKFYAADARYLRLSRNYQLAVSTFESMNHITSLPELEAVFRNVAAALVEGGCFVFDILTEETYLVEWKKSSAVVEDDNACFVRGGYNPETRIAHADITMFRLTDAWRRSDATILERYYPVSDVGEALRAASFGSVNLLALEGRVFFRADLGTSGLSTGRVASGRSPGARGRT